jgi:hypothetical protein
MDVGKFEIVVRCHIHMVWDFFAINLTRKAVLVKGNLSWLRLKT